MGCNYYQESRTEMTSIRAIIFIVWITIEFLTNRVSSSVIKKLQRFQQGIQGKRNGKSSDISHKAGVRQYIKRTLTKTEIGYQGINEINFNKMFHN